MADLRLGGIVDPATHTRGEDAAAVPSEELTTHAVIVGMTGSGKTGLGVGIIEECLRAGVATLLIDPKGDLTNLALTFPDLSASRVRAMGQSRRRGQGRAQRVRVRRQRGEALDRRTGGLGPRPGRRPRAARRGSR